MEYIRICLKFEDESIGIMSFVVKSPDFEKEGTDEEIQAVVDKSNWDKPVISWRRIEENEIPTDRTYRNAWIDNDGITHDMAKVKELHLNLLREERAKILPQLDIQWSIAFAKGNTEEAAEIEARRQALRDRPESAAIELDACETVEQVKLVTLE